MKCRIVKGNVAIGIKLDLMADLLGGQPAGFEKVVSIVVDDALKEINQIGNRIVDLAAEQKPSVKLCNKPQAIFDSIYRFA